MAMASFAQHDGNDDNGYFAPNSESFKPSLDINPTKRIFAIWLLQGNLVFSELLDYILMKTLMKTIATLAICWFRTKALNRGAVPAPRRGREPLHDHFWHLAGAKMDPNVFKILKKSRTMWKYHRNISKISSWPILAPGANIAIFIIFGIFGTGKILKRSLNQIVKQFLPSLSGWTLTSLLLGSMWYKRCCVGCNDNQEWDVMTINNQTSHCGFSE